MPNWCLNNISITGTTEAMDMFRNSLESYLGGKIFQFNQIVPHPKVCPDNDDWYNWNSKNWGTKWDVQEFITDNGDSISIIVHTAWHPPLEWAQNVTRKIPGLKITIKYDVEDFKHKGIETFT